jgi:hypothetical protein
MRNGAVNVSAREKNNKFDYSSNIKDMPFLFVEMRKTARLMEEGKSSEDILRLSVEENIYQLEKEKRRRAMAAKMILRLSVLNAPLISLIANGADNNAKLAAFYALIKTDKLFFEFMREVFRDKYSLGQDVITDDDFVVFLTSKAGESEKVSSWTPNNLGRVKNTYKNVLCEAGLAKKRDDYLLITKPILDDTTRGCWNNFDEYAASMLLEG